MCSFPYIQKVGNALHRDFERLMVDKEIFIDRIVDQRTNDLIVTVRTKNAAKRKKDTEQVKNHLFRVFFVT